MTLPPRFASVCPMKWLKLWALVLSLCAMAMAQQPVAPAPVAPLPQPAAPQAPAANAALGGVLPMISSDEAATALAVLPGYRNIYCAGFIADRPIERSLYIIAAEEGGQKNEFATGDVVYLSLGAANIVNPSGEYQVIRPVHDIVKEEIFRGQTRVLRSLGQMYEEVGRVRVNVVHPGSAVAIVTNACTSLTVGDLLVPFNVRPAPPMRQSAGFDRFAPPTGKTGGSIVYAKEFGNLVGRGDIAYLDIGATQGVAVGQYYRIYRPYSKYGEDRLWGMMKNYEEKASGQRMNIRLTPAERAALPREVLGEMVITHVEGKSATALVTFAQKEVFVGDLVELQ